MRVLSELVEVQPKSKIKAGEGLSCGKYKFFTSSNIQTKWLNECQYEKPALIFGTGGMPSIHYCETPFSTSTDCVVMCAKPGISLEVIYRYLSANIHLLAEGFHGIGLQHISKKYILELEVPELDETKQKVIAELANKLDALIFLRKEQLAKLDQLVKSRFVELFGETDEFESVPLNDSVDEMFIGPFGSSLKNECFVVAEQGYCMVYEQKHAIKKIMDVDTRFVDEKKYKELRRFTVQGGDIIVSCRGTIGETFIVPEDAPLGIMHPSIMKIRLKTTAYNRVFFNHLLQTVLDRHEADANGSGVKMAITATALGKEHFIRPPMELQQQFAVFVEQTDKSKLAIQQSLDKLETLKKSLMQKYFG